MVLDRRRKKSVKTCFYITYNGIINVILIVARREKEIISNLNRTKKKNNNNKQKTVTLHQRQ